MLSRPWALLHFFLFAMASSVSMMEMAIAPGRSSTRDYSTTIGQALRLGSVFSYAAKAQGLPNGGAISPAAADPFKAEQVTKELSFTRSSLLQACIPCRSN